MLPFFKLGDAVPSTPSRHTLKPTGLAGLLVLLGWGANVCAQVSVSSQVASTTPLAAEGLRLKSSAQLAETITPEARKAMPTFLSGDHVTSRTDLESVVQGDAVLRRGDTVIRADRLEYYQPDDLAKAQGNVSINRAGNVYEGPALELKVDAVEGFFSQPTYRFLQNGGHGQADRVDFLDESHAVITNGTYTTCRRLPGPDWMPDWILQAASLSLDNEEEVGVAKGALLSFKGMPLLPVPYMSFPLTDKRKTGVLPPTIGVDSVNGMQFTLPYYLNIAPNRDATLTPTVMTRRGVDLGAEFRFLEPSYNGILRGNYMPGDALRQSDRWSVNSSYQSRFDTGFAAIGPVGLSLSVNRVSDDNYWRDFTASNANPVLTQRLLANDAQLSWASGNLSASVRTLKWQTLADPTAPIVPPYDRLPQVVARYTRSNVNGFDYSLTGDLTRFNSDPIQTLQPNGQRNFMLAQASRTWRESYGYVTPKIQLHATRYEFDTGLANGDRTATRAVPTVSLDGGLFFERDASFFGRAFRQTLEPRVFYVNTPFRDQSLLPNFDTGLNDFNFATIYSENAFVGNDRISDNNLLTVGVTTRLLDPQTGAEAARFAMAQRYRFQDQLVTLPGAAPEAAGFSDVLLGGAVNWTPVWSTDSTIQYNPNTQLSTRATLGARYSPGNYRVFNAAYRFQRDASEQVDVSWQWPLNDLWGDRGQNLGPGQGQGSPRWYSVGRLNYSLVDRQLVDMLMGFEYDAGCWLGRVVLQQLQTGVGTATSSISFQLEFVGFTRVGSNPLKTLKDNIPRYQYLREQISAPSRFSNYD